MAAERLEERLEAAANKATQSRPVFLDGAHARGTPDLVDRCGADEGHLDSSQRWLIRHEASLGVGASRRIGGIADFVE
jgi:hypothetical protein